MAWGKENKHAVQSALIYEAAQTHASFTDLFVPSLSSQAEDRVAHQHTESEPSRAPGAPGRGCSVPHALTQKHTGQQPAPVRANSSEATQLELML